MPSRLDESTLSLARAALACAPRRGWWHDAACTDDDTSVFFPGDGAADRRSSRRSERIVRSEQTAKARCANCAVRRDCLSEALRIPSLQGIWGGTNDHERRQLRKALAIGTTVVFDESAPAPGTSGTMTAANGSGATADASPDPAPPWVPPSWVPTGDIDSRRWKSLGSGPGTPGHTVIGDVEVLCRVGAEPGQVAAYGRVVTAGGAHDTRAPQGVAT